MDQLISRAGCAGINRLVAQILHPKLAASGGYTGLWASSDERLGGGSAHPAATAQGAQIIRTHDVAETVQAWRCKRGWGKEGFSCNCKEVHSSHPNFWTGGLCPAYIQHQLESKKTGRRTAKDMAGIFGTDGVRARINTGSMRAESVVRLALAAGRWFADETADDARMTSPMVVIGKDTRLSGYMLESALVAGFTSIGINCRLLGPVPTAAVSYLTHSLRADFGVMISASHNPHHDNGIKLFGPDGYKLDDAIEEDISALMRGSIALAPPDGLGRARRIVNSAQRYMEFAKATFDTAQSLAGMRLWWIVRMGPHIAPPLTRWLN